MKWCCIKGHLACTSRGSRPQDSSLPNQHTRPHFKDPPLNQSIGFGRPWLPTNADFLCSLWSTTGVGLPTSLLGMGWNILITVRCVTSSQKISITCSFYMCLQDIFGLKGKWGCSSCCCLARIPLRTTSGANLVCRCQAKLEGGSTF
jgi:hypothetical protein